MVAKTKKKRSVKAQIVESAINESVGGPTISDNGGNGHFPSEAEIVTEKAVEVATQGIDFTELNKILEGIDPDNPNVVDASDQTVEQRLGVMQRLITAVMQDRDYLQSLLMAAFKDERQAGYCADAIAEAQRYGCSIRPIMNRIYAQCGVRSERALQVLSAINSYTINTRNNNNLPKWKKDQGKKQIA